ncbi:efflux RND transporter periplasmic adaptor subunit [Limnohabitans sp. Rim28]|uniref:efflux RND transporter periplasmic adaptor subunit n=1 Tax=Limnohabitans sp. Rim28 TaxID=1100720 RepID=UPI00030875B3|nr:efflux RND transporter periplasmic adaptor subunit [Limnohabitans sp. Rim28]PVE08780.1 MexH family multidrug efflux RND transporter periplasmic adaptor subunit [Limnohabitans sp. Rim28]
MAYKKKYTVLAILGISMASGAAWWWQNKAPDAEAGKTATASAAPGAGPAAGGGPARPTSVEVAKVESMTLVDETQAVGSLRSRQGVMLRPEVGGRVKQIFFNDGQRVRKGQLMVQFDDQLPQAQLAQARAELSITEANHKRNQDLVAQNFISQRSLDESSAALEVSRAKLSLAQATLQRLQVLAPFDGITGLKQINVGDYLKDGADMVNVEDIDAVLLDFRLPERFQAKIRAGQKAQLTVDALPGRPFSAIIQAVDPLIDANGRSVGVRGCIDNRQQQLRPGMFARVNAVFGSRENALVIPEEAIIPQGGRTFVVKIVAGDKPDVKVSERVVVKVGLRLPGKVEILEGLSAGDTVVTAGHQRLQKDGTVVRVVDLSQPGGGRPAGGPPGAGGPGAGGPGAGGPGAAPAAAGAQGPRPGAGAGAGASPMGQRPGGAGKPGQGPGKNADMAGPNPCLRGADATR